MYSANAIELKESYGQVGQVLKNPPSLVRSSGQETKTIVKTFWPQSQLWLDSAYGSDHLLLAEPCHC